MRPPERSGRHGGQVDCESILGVHALWTPLGRLVRDHCLPHQLWNRLWLWAGWASGFWHVRRPGDHQHLCLYGAEVPFYIFKGGGGVVGLSVCSCKDWHGPGRPSAGRHVCHRDSRRFRSGKRQLLQCWLSFLLDAYGVHGMSEHCGYGISSNPHPCRPTHGWSTEPQQDRGLLGAAANCLQLWGGHRPWCLGWTFYLRRLR
mmetsp:Transcript_59263/g.111030  ORF Transcript_59263/g.111030 Transcript_59263/m.111030 type:complete len:202 (+) Transcript_59263:833-1438(+)